MASGVVGKVDSRHSRVGQKRLGKEIWCGGEKRQKEEEKKGREGGSGLDSGEFGFGLFTWRDGEGAAVCQRWGVAGLAWCVSDVIA